jgi:hypothetical protein
MIFTKIFIKLNINKVMTYVPLIIKVYDSEDYLEENPINSNHNAKLNKRY